jgi:hypothetical protein
VAGDHLELRIDQDRHIEVEGLDTLRNLSDLRFAVEPWVRRVQPELADWPVNNLQTLGLSGSGLFGVSV